MGWCPGVKGTAKSTTVGTMLISAVLVKARLHADHGMLAKPQYVSVCPASSSYSDADVKQSVKHIHEASHSLTIAKSLCFTQGRLSNLSKIENCGPEGGE